MAQHSSTTAWSSQMWFLRLVYNRNACDSREAEFNRKPVKVTIQTLRSSAPHPFLTSLLLKLASGVFLTRHGFCFDGQKRNSTEICQHVQKISLCYKVYKRPLFSPDVNFAFKGQKMELNGNLWMTKIMRHVQRITETAGSGLEYLQRCLMHSINIKVSFWFLT